MSNFVQYDRELAHEFCRKNKDSIGKSRRVGCFACRLRFDASAVKHFNTRGNAKCPSCDADCIIPDADVHSVDSPEGIALLNSMNSYWFGSSSSSSARMRPQ